MAGFQFYDGKEVINNLKENVQLQLSAEPDNQYDKYAVEVYFKNKKLGYIPKNENKNASIILLAGVQLDCRTHKINSQKYAWNTVIVEVYTKSYFYYF